MKISIFFLLLFIPMLISPATAFEDTVERYPTHTLTDYWIQGSSVGSSYYPTVELFPSGSDYHTIYFENPRSRSLNTAMIYSKNDVFTDNMSFVVKNCVVNCTDVYGTGIDGGTEATAKIQFFLYNSSAGYMHTFDAVTITNISSTGYTLDDATVEIFVDSSNIYAYVNGIYVGNLGTFSPASAKFGIQIESSGSSGKYVSMEMYADDISTGSAVGLSETYNELVDTIPYTWKINGFNSYPDSEFSVTLYSLTADNAGKVVEVVAQNQSANMEYPRSSTLDNNFGLYLIEITRDGGVLADQYFYYYQSSSPHGLPEVLFRVETDTAAEIRDEDNNGDIVPGGNSVYLYPDVKEDGYYNITVDFSEPSYSRRVELTKIYNTTTLNGSIFSYSGLTENYNVSRDSTQIGQTNGSDSWDNTVNWIGQDSYIYEFEPDLSLPGFWGYVKNSETQTAIKSATVSITNGTDTFYIYTDENGMYYLTNGIANESTYTVQAKKTNYESSNPYNLTTTAGATTRQDLYLSKSSGSGIYYAPHDVGFIVLEYWYSGAGLPGVSYTISSEDDGEIKTGTTDSKGMFTGSDMTGGTNYTIVLQYNGKTYTEYIEPSLTEYTFILNKEGVLHQYANSWLTLSYTENTNNVTIAYESNKTITGASLTATANNGTTVYSQTLTTDTGSFTFETGGEGDYTLNFHIQATDGDTASQSWGLSYPNQVPLFPDSYPAWLKNILFSGIVIVFLLSFGKAKNDIACGSVAILTSMGYIFEWFTCSFYFVVLVWIIALGAVFLHYKRTGGIG